ncbi:MAG: hypothetical protein ACE5JX_16070, partial [Acidobacteriota bacterium]
MVERLQYFAFPSALGLADFFVDELHAVNGRQRRKCQIGRHEGLDVSGKGGRLLFVQTRLIGVQVLDVEIALDGSSYPAGKFDSLEGEAVLCLLGAGKTF